MLPEAYLQPSVTTQPLTLRYLRRLRNLTQEDLARKVGVDRVTIIRWEKRETNPSSEAVLRMAQVMKLPLELVTDAVNGGIHVA